MHHLTQMFTVPDSVFARIGYASVDEATHTCSHCGTPIPPVAVQQGYVRRECTCEREERYRSQAIQPGIQQTPLPRRSYVDRCYTWLGQEGLEEGLTEKTFENFYSEDPELSLAVAQIAEWTRNPEGTLILHSAGCGIGKTHLAAAICNRQRAQEKACLFTTGLSLFNAIVSTFDDEEKGGFHRIMAQLFTTPLLVIDDTDKAKWTNFRGEVYFEVVNKRVNNGKPIVLTTRAIKKDISDLDQFLGHDVVSRLQVGLLQIEMKGRDYRKNLIRRVK